MNLHSRAGLITLLRKVIDSFVRKKRRCNNQFKYGVEIPRNLKEALVLDAKNGNHLWRDAIAKEMKALSDMKVFNIRDISTVVPKDHKRIPMWIIFDVKMDLRRKARLVAGGHVTKTDEHDNNNNSWISKRYCC